MKIDIIGRKYNISDRLNTIISKKLEKFNKYFDENAAITVVCRQDNKDKYTMEITIKFAGSKMLRSEITSENMYSNIDIILPKIEKQLRRYKTELLNKLKTDAFSSEFIYGADPVDEKKQIVKVKKFALSAMSVDSAITEMDLIGNDFYVFLNQENDKVNVIYKRKDGQIGLIDLTY